MEQAWECPDTTPQYWSCRLCAKGGVGADQFNLQHPTSVNITVLQIHDKSICDTLLLQIQEIKRDIVYRRMNLPPSAQQVTTIQLLTVHLLYTLPYEGYAHICNTL
jgi:hypothetical protein